MGKVADAGLTLNGPILFRLFRAKRGPLHSIDAWRSGDAGAIAQLITPPSSLSSVVDADDRYLCT